MAVSQAQNLGSHLTPSLSTERIARFSGFGLTKSSDGYLYRPTRIEEAAAVFELARKEGRQVVLRGAGRSYGDAAIGPECVVIENARLNRILGWDPESGVIEAESGVTIEELWRHVLDDGYWPPVVSGTMYPTLGGALAMNIHGKNNFKAGTLGEHILELEALTPSGRLVTTRKGEPLMHELVSSAGLLAMTTKVRLQMKRIGSGDVRVLPLSMPGWDAQFEAFESLEREADYMVSWIDCFGRGPSAGRGLFHAAWYLDEPSDHPATLLQSHQDLPDTVLGYFPKSMVWRSLRRLNNRLGMKFINAAKYGASKTLGDGKPHPQSLVGFSFLLDYVPNWRWAYLPHGFIQYQSFVPKDHAHRVFAHQVELQQRSGIESFLGVMKRHRPDPFLFSHGVDGYSLALDFKVTPSRWKDLQELCWRMNDLVLEAGGRFYFAKDSTLRPSDVRSYLGPTTMARFSTLKREFDPHNLLTSSLAQRVGLA